MTFAAQVDSTTTLAQALAQDSTPPAPPVSPHSVQSNMVHGTSEPWRNAEKWMDKAAHSGRAPVLVLGEEGTGKEVVVRALHANSRRNGKPFRILNCGALDPNLIASELFGHKKGAFTGANESRTGLLPDAAGGTLFIDEVGELPLAVQPMLLRFLQEHTVRVVGTNDDVVLDVWVIAATNRNLDVEVAAGRFRRDLRDRLRVVEIKLPTLRERREDIPKLADHFLRKYSKLEQVKFEPFSDEILTLICSCPWPGNVRALETFIESFCVFGADPRDLPSLLADRFGNNTQHPSRERDRFDLPDNLEEVSLWHADRILKDSRNRTEAAARLGVSSRSLARMIAKLAAKSEAPESATS